MSYLVFDIETTMTESFKRKANPYDDRNWIVCWSGLLVNEQHIDHNGDPHSWQTLFQGYYSEDTKNNFASEFLPVLGLANRIICHNAKFDIGYLWRYPWFHRWLEDGGKIWCTMVAEYIITGQFHKYPSLNSCSDKYGGGQKIDVIKELWDNGVATQDIDRTLLLEYNKEDVLNTNIVLTKQLEVIKKQEQSKLMTRAMEDILCTIEMEYNGMYIDEQIARQCQEESKNKLSEINTQILELVNRNVYKYDEWNPSSNDHISLWFFGGILKTQQKLPKLDDNGAEQYFKSGLKKGQVVTTLQQVNIEIPGLGVNPLEEWKAKKEGMYSTDETVLSLISKGVGIAASLASLLLEYRAEAKVLGTYYNGLLDLRYEKDGCVHPDYQLVATWTGRMSCRNPNLQNQKNNKGA